ncbi:MAG: protoporphyrinogen oxidase HemJ [Hyphomicrobiaceae bacterium]|nr:protoporphyrinogen oxidase HemJ [Hyphomicrobiaceae bacterium]
MDAFLWLKALHVISIIAWMAGLFYLPRLFVYHSQQKSGSETSELFKLMERRLLKVIMNPAMISSWIFGFIIAAKSHAFSQPWFHVKLLLVIVLTIFHIMLGKWRKDFEADNNQRTEGFYRLINEVPTVLMVIIVVLVFVKPF